MSDVNMDVRKHPDATEPVLEFSLPVMELDHTFKAGEIGSITLPVEVEYVDERKVTFRKRPSKITTSQFRQATVGEMEENIGVAER